MGYDCLYCGDRKLVVEEALPRVCIDCFITRHLFPADQDYWIPQCVFDLQSVVRARYWALAPLTESPSEHEFYQPIPFPTNEYFGSIFKTVGDVLSPAEPQHLSFSSAHIVDDTPDYES